MLIRQTMDRVGIRYAFVGTEHQSEFMEADICFPYGYAADKNILIGMENVINVLSRMIYYVEQCKNPEIFLIGGQWWLIPYNIENQTAIYNLVYLEATKPVINIFGMIIPFTLNFIHTRLCEEQVPTYHQIRGKKTAHRDKVCSWSVNTIRALLDNRFYIGEFSYHKTEILTVGSHKPKKLPPSEWITIPEHHESVITRELFEKARYRKTGRNTRRKAPKHPLTGKLYCGGCGYAMIYKRKAGEKLYRHFECHKHSLLKIPACCTYYNAGVLEEIVLAMLNKELLKLLEYKDSREVLKTALKDRREILKKRIRGIGKQLKDIESDKVKRYEAYAEAKLDAEAYKQETASAEQEI